MQRVAPLLMVVLLRFPLPIPVLQDLCTIPMQNRVVPAIVETALTIGHIIIKIFILSQFS